MSESLFLIKLQALIAGNFIKKEALAQVFSSEFCEISKNTFFHRTPLVAASDYFIYKDFIVFKKGVIAYGINFFKNDSLMC